MVVIHFVMKSRCSRVHLFLGANTSVMSLMMANPYVDRGPCASSTESTVESSIMAFFTEGTIELCPRCHKILRAVLAPTVCKISTLESESLPELFKVSTHTFSTFTVFFLPARLRFLVEGGFGSCFVLLLRANSSCTKPWIFLKSPLDGVPQLYAPQPARTYLRVQLRLDRVGGVG
jgi:hypothetical protein